MSQDGLIWNWRIVQKRDLMKIFRNLQKIGMITLKIYIKGIPDYLKGGNKYV